MKRGEAKHGWRSLHETLPAAGDQRFQGEPQQECVRGPRPEHGLKTQANPDAVNN